MRYPAGARTSTGPVAPMQNRLGADLELLVWLDLVIRGNDRVKQSDIYRAQQDRLEKLPKTEEAIETEIAELARRSRHLDRILHPAAEPDPRLAVPSPGCATGVPPPPTR